MDNIHIVDHEGEAAALHAFYHVLLGQARPFDWAFDLACLYVDAPRVDAAMLASPFDRKEIKFVV
jgi:hypothetical protein